ncbi:MAG: hypothetical protein AAFZ01_03165 [Pseudomonadota bacterium]
MHIVAGLLTLATVVGVVIYRLYMISQSPIGRGVADAAGGVQKHLRRRAWQKKLGDPLRDIDDPRLAATAMMVALAQSDGALSERQEQAITTQVQATFGASSAIAQEMLAHARWLVRDVSEPETCFLKVRPVILAQCSAVERDELVEMLKAIAEAGRDKESQRQAVDKLQRALKT